MNGEWSRLWTEVDAWAAKSKAEFDATESAVKKVQGWKFCGVEDGVKWTARHRDHGRIHFLTSAGLLAEIERLAEAKKLSDEKWRNMGFRK